MEQTYIFSNDSDDDFDYPGDGSEVLIMNAVGTGVVRPDLIESGRNYWLKLTVKVMMK